MNLFLVIETIDLRKITIQNLKTLLMNEASFFLHSLSDHILHLSKFYLFIEFFCFISGQLLSMLREFNQRNISPLLVNNCY